MLTWDNFSRMLIAALSPFSHPIFHMNPSSLEINEASQFIFAPSPVEDKGLKLGYAPKPLLRSHLPFLVS